MSVDALPNLFLPFRDTLRIELHHLGVFLVKLRISRVLSSAYRGSSKNSFLYIRH